MNNSIASRVPISLDEKIIEAALLIEQAVKNGSVCIRPDRSFTVNGLPLSRSTPSHGVQTSKPAANKFLFDGNVWTLKFHDQIRFESNRLGWQ